MNSKNISIRTFYLYLITLAFYILSLLFYFPVMMEKFSGFGADLPNTVKFYFNSSELVGNYIILSTIIIVFFTLIWILFGKKKPDLSRKVAYIILKIVRIVAITLLAVFPVLSILSGELFTALTESLMIVGFLFLLSLLIKKYGYKVLWIVLAITNIILILGLYLAPALFLSHYNNVQM